MLNKKIIERALLLFLLFHLLTIKILHGLSQSRYDQPSTCTSLPSNSIYHLKIKVKCTVLEKCVMHSMNITVHYIWCTGRTTKYVCYRQDYGVRSSKSLLQYTLKYYEH